MADRSAATPLGRARPCVESLEDRQLPSGGPTPLTFHGGPAHALGMVVNKVQVVNIFWGTGFRAGASLHASVAYLNGFGRYIVTSPLMDVLAQYGVGHGHFQGARLLDGVPAHGFVSDLQIYHVLNQRVRSHQLPPPGPQTLYMVYLPPGVSIGPGGYHEDQWREILQPNGQMVFHDLNFAAITWAPGELGNTFTASHELAEAVTDPRVGYGWFNDAAWQRGKFGEVADFADDAQPAHLNGYTVTQLYSNRNGGLVRP